MSERYADDLRLSIEASSGDVEALAGYRPFAAGRVVAGPSTGRQRADVALFSGAHQPGSEVRARNSDCLLIPGDVDPQLAILVPPLASALAIWETLQLELGDAAVWTTGAPLSALVGQVALWRGACPGIALGSATNTQERHAAHVDWIDGSDQESAAASLAAAVASRPGFAAVDLSGHAEVIDVLLEAIPRWGRLLLAGPAGAPVTIDFYKNVHRKGIVMATTTVEPASIFDGGVHADARAQIGRAIAILRNPAMSASCRRLLGAQPGARHVSVAS
jgi:threonine dehydrogenase-like Zn-dependent dehydrogenase